jgi:hypothetical protein
MNPRQEYFYFWCWWGVGLGLNTGLYTFNVVTLQFEHQTGILMVTDVKKEIPFFTFFLEFFFSTLLDNWYNGNYQSHVLTKRISNCEGTQLLSMRRHC